MFDVNVPNSNSFQIDTFLTIISVQLSTLKIILIKRTYICMDAGVIDKYNYITP